MFEDLLDDTNRVSFEDRINNKFSSYETVEEIEVDYVRYAVKYLDVRFHSPAYKITLYRNQIISIMLYVNTEEYYAQDIEDDYYNEIEEDIASEFEITVSVFVKFRDIKGNI